MSDLNPASCVHCGDYGCNMCGYCACGVPLADCKCAEVHDLVGYGHTEHCAKRQVWGDGECECGADWRLR